MLVWREIEAKAPLIPLAFSPALGIILNEAVNSVAADQDLPRNILIINKNNNSS